MISRHYLQRRFVAPFLSCPLLFLGACGGGADNPLAGLYTSLAIYSIDSPESASTDTAISVSVKARTSGEISDGDIEWHFDQTSGRDISNLAQTLSDGNHTARFTFRTPEETGSICFRVRVQNSNHFYTDSAPFCIAVR